MSVITGRRSSCGRSRLWGQGPETKRHVEDLRKDDMAVASKEEMTGSDRSLEEGKVNDGIKISAHEKRWSTHGTGIWGKGMSSLLKRVGF